MMYLFHWFKIHAVYKNLGGRRDTVRKAEHVIMLQWRIEIVELVFLLLLLLFHSGDSWWWICQNWRCTECLRWMMLIDQEILGLTRLAPVKLVWEIACLTLNPLLEKLKSQLQSFHHRTLKQQQKHAFLILILPGPHLRRKHKHKHKRKKLMH